MKDFERWLRNRATELSELRAHPDPDLQVFEDCAAVVREAADQAADVGLLDVYERFKSVRFCSPRDARALLSSVLATLPSRSGSSEVGFLNATQAADYLGVTRGSLYGLVERGRLTPFRGPRRRYRFTREMLDEYIKTNSA
jgi:excisionase family DNA binding protein